MTNKRQSRRRDREYVTTTFTLGAKMLRKLNRFWPGRFPNRSAAIERGVELVMSERGE